MASVLRTRPRRERRHRRDRQPAPPHPVAHSRRPLNWVRAATAPGRGSPAPRSRSRTTAAVHTSARDRTVWLRRSQLYGTSRPSAAATRRSRFGVVMMAAPPGRGTHHHSPSVCWMSVTCSMISPVKRGGTARRGTARRSRRRHHCWCGTSCVRRARVVVEVARKHPAALSTTDPARSGRGPCAASCAPRPRQVEAPPTQMPLRMGVVPLRVDVGREDVAGRSDGVREVQHRAAARQGDAPRDGHGSQADRRSSGGPADDSGSAGLRQHAGRSRAGRGSGTAPGE